MKTIRINTLRDYFVFNHRIKVFNKLIDQKYTGEIRAIVYLDKEGDQGNRCLLTAHFVVVILKGNKQYFKLSDLKSIEHYERKLLLPLILGGVILPLSLVSLSRDYFNPYIIMFAIFSSLYFIYRGWTGINIVALNMKSGLEELIIPNVTDHLMAFIQYVNATLTETENELKRESLIYLSVEKKVYEKYHSEGKWPVDSLQGGLEAATYQQSKKWFLDQSKDRVLVKIDPHLLNAVVKYQYSPDLKELCPYIYGSINLNAIIDVVEII